LRFWDSSALVPLVVAESASRICARWLAEDPEIAVWTMTPVEIVSALRRLGREGTLTDAQVVEREINVLSWMPRVHVVTDVERVKIAALALLRAHVGRRRPGREFVPQLRRAAADRGAAGGVRGPAPGRERRIGATAPWPGSEAVRAVIRREPGEDYPGAGPARRAG
jgi:uncharacterized protein with PIN domain